MRDPTRHFLGSSARMIAGTSNSLEETGHTCRSYWWTHRSHCLHNQLTCPSPCRPRHSNFGYSTRCYPSTLAIGDLQGNNFSAQSENLQAFLVLSNEADKGSIGRKSLVLAGLGR